MEKEQSLLERFVVLRSSPPRRGRHTRKSSNVLVATGTKHALASQATRDLGAMLMDLDTASPEETPKYEKMQ